MLQDKKAIMARRQEMYFDRTFWSVVVEMLLYSGSNFLFSKPSAGVSCLAYPIIFLEPPLLILGSDDTENKALIRRILDRLFYEFIMY